MHPLLLAAKIGLSLVAFVLLLALVANVYIVFHYFLLDKREVWGKKVDFLVLAALTCSALVFLALCFYAAQFIWALDWPMRK